MNSRVLGVAGLVLVLLAIVALGCTFAFLPALDRSDWADPEALAVGTAILCFVGCGLGVASIKTPAGKAAVIVGCLFLAFFLYRLQEHSAPRPVEPARAASEGDPAGEPSQRQDDSSLPTKGAPDAQDQRPRGAGAAR